MRIPAFEPTRKRTATQGWTRREWLAGAAGAGLPGGAQERRPNLLFLLADDQRWDSLGCMGNPIVRTPNLDRLAAEGVTFTRNFVTTSICMVSRASIFTGLYGRSHRILDFNDPFPAERFARSYPALLKDAGYRTGFIGKWGIDGGQMPREAFDYFRGFQGQGRYFPNGENGPHLTRLMGDQAVEFLRGPEAGRPFCLSVSFKAPHAQDEDPRQYLPDPEDAELYRDVTLPAPRTAAPEYLAALPAAVQRSEGRRRWGPRFSTPELFQSTVKNYYRLITGIDREAGRLMRELTTLGLDGNTVVIYSSDNGVYLGEHGLADKWLMHEESIRTPLIVRDPRLVPSRRGARVSAMSLNLDLAPTLLALAGAAAPPVQGRSLVPLLSGEAAAWRSEFFYEHHYRFRGWIPATEGIRTERWKYTQYLDETPPFEELYDLERDEREEWNLARLPEHQPQLGALRGRREAWRRALEEWRPGAAWHDPR